LHRAGFQISAAIENDLLAAQSHATNFYRREPQNIVERHAQPRDISNTEPALLLSDLGIATPHEKAIDVIVGGPPCQAFARVGRAKLREIAEHPEAFKLDPRSNLYLRYLYYVRKLRPLAILIENVPDVLNHGGHNIAEEICDTLSALGYVCQYTLLNAVFYGVPEMRERMFLIAYHEELSKRPVFPSPTHFIELPRGYESSRQVALRTIHADLFCEERFYCHPPRCVGEPHKAVSAREALADLPPITDHLNGKLTRGPRRLDQYVPYYTNGPISPYIREMRNWPGFQANGGVTDHAIRSLPRDYAIFRRMNPGDQYPEAYEHALELLNDRLVQLRRQGHHIKYGTREYKELKRSIVPPYDPGKFPNKWRKMEANLPARTLMAHLGKDSYSHIHYDSDQARTISVREAARLQSFPDGFIFKGTMNPAFRQIGNAVPPLLAFRIALEMRDALGIGR
jgi:DNA (cytosine-5)-methyltransferase 1